MTTHTTGNGGHIPVTHVEFEVFGDTVDQITAAAKTKIRQLFDRPDFDLWNDFQIIITPNQSPSPEVSVTEAWKGTVVGRR